MNKRTAIKATIALVIMLGISMGLSLMLIKYTRITGYIGIGIFLCIMWMMTYNVIENRTKNN
jgi:uncharacterized membrane protein